MQTKQPWFGDRQFGIGSLRPVTWQGWLVSLGLVLAVVADARLIGLRTPLGVILLIVACVAYAVIAHISTGRWWSWGPFGRHTKD